MRSGNQAVKFWGKFFRCTITVGMLMGMVVNICHAVPSYSDVKNQTIIYAALGEELSRYALDPRTAVLTKLGSLKMPANAQFAEFHPCKCFMYVVSSNAGNGTLGAAGVDLHLNLTRELH